MSKPKQPGSGTELAAGRLIAIIQRFYRAPKPSCNWCPRHTIVLILDGRTGEVFEYAKVAEGHNMTKQQVFESLLPKYPALGHAIEFMGELELTVSQFKRISE